MAGITLAVAEAKLEVWLAAEGKVATGQSYEIDNRKLQRADLGQIRESIKFWQEWVDRLSATAGGKRNRSRLGVPG